MHAVDTPCGNPFTTLQLLQAFMNVLPPTPTPNACCECYEYPGTCLISIEQRT